MCSRFSVVDSICQNIKQLVPAAESRQHLWGAFFLFGQHTLTLMTQMQVTIDYSFAMEYCQKQNCLFLFQPSGKYSIPGKRKSYFCKKPELLKAHLQLHFQAGGEGAAKLIRGEEEAIILQSHAQHFLDIGRGELISSKPFIVKLKAP